MKSYDTFTPEMRQELEQGSQRVLQEASDHDVEYFENVLQIAKQKSRELYFGRTSCRECFAFQGVVRLFQEVVKEMKARKHRRLKSAIASDAFCEAIGSCILGETEELLSILNQDRHATACMYRIAAYESIMNGTKAVVITALQTLMGITPDESGDIGDAEDDPTNDHLTH